MPQKEHTQPHKKAGLPGAGQLDFALHKPPTVVLTPAATGLEQVIADRDRVRELRDEAAGRHAGLDRLAQVHAVRTMAATVLAKYPDARTLTLMQNDDGENQYDVLDFRNADGDVIRHASTGIDWDRDPGDNDPTLEEMAWDLDLKDDSWAAGVATVTTDKYRGKVAVIDLQAALAVRPDPAPSAGRSLP